VQGRKFSRFKFEAVRLVRERGVWSAQATRDAEVPRKWVRELGSDPVQGGADGGAEPKLAKFPPKKAGRGWHHHSRALRRRLMGQGE
jgi:transposase-like protein